jgi:flagellar hook protein FlgE
MSLGGAMNSGVSGLKSFSNAMGVIGNNLANTNTIGFKAGRTLFSDLIPTNVSGSGGTSQIGRGVSLSLVDNIFTQGSLESSSSNLDLAIEGTGFFIVRNPDSQANNYTRAGAFRLNEAGYLVNPEGYIVQGYPSLANGNFMDLAGDIQVNTRSSVPGEASSMVTLTTNLNANDAIIAGGWLVNDPIGTSNFATTSQVYDSLGNTHLITTYFTKTDINTWKYYQTVPAGDIDSSAHDAADIGIDPVTNDETIVRVAEGTFEFDPSGLLSQINGVLKDNYGPTWPNVTIDMGKLNWINGATNNLPLDYKMNVTQFATDSKVVTQQADGFASGYLSDVSVDGDGTIIGTYTNGKTRQLAKLSLAKFSNTNGLEKLGKNLYAATASSGPADIGTAGSGVGKIFSNSLEQSTVDIAEEFTKMIITQRSFQANSKTITTTDEMLNEVINLKR